MTSTTADPPELLAAGGAAAPREEPEKLLARAWADPHLRGVILGASACGAALAVLYAANLRHFLFTWSTDENYGHGFLVPLISLYFARESLRRGPVAPGGGAVLGGVLLVASVLARLATVVVPVGLVGDLGFLLGIAGIVALMGGREALRRLGFAVAFLVFMVPLPVALYTTLANPLQRIVSGLGASVLGLLGIPVLCEGNMMTLPGDVRMFVAEACSGMRQLTGFLALTTAVAYLSGRPGWQRAILVGSSVPIAMTANVLRVTLTGLIMFHLDPKYASGRFHTVEGMLMMGVGLGLLWLECAAMKVLTTPAPEA